MTISEAASALRNDLNGEVLSRSARFLYRDSTWPFRAMQQLRPYACPFEQLVTRIADGSRVLDIGCGAGLLLGLAAATCGRRFDGFGFDVSRKAIEAATKMTSRAASLNRGARLTFKCIGLNEPWPEGTFDRVFLIDVLHHVPAVSQEAFLRQAISKVSPTGMLVYKDMCEAPRWRALANRLHDLVIAGDFIHYVPVAAVERWCESEGMEVIERKDINRLWYGHELRIMTRGPSTDFGKPAQR